jgi:hypothetical protein
VYVGAQGAEATLANAPQPISPTEATVLGAGLGAGLGAACLAASDLLNLVTSGRVPHARRVSMWGFGEGAETDAGPAHGTAALHRQIPGRDDCMDC